MLQVECHPYYTQNGLKKRIAKHGTVIESWYPLGHADAGLPAEPIFAGLAEKYSKTNVKIILRWHIQMGNVVFPKTANPSHMQENISIFDFELTADEMGKTVALDCGKRFFQMSLAEQEAHLGGFAPAD